MGANSNLRHKDNDLFPILNEKLQRKMNLALIQPKSVIRKCLFQNPYLQMRKKRDYKIQCSNDRFGIIISVSSLRKGEQKGG